MEWSDILFLKLMAALVAMYWWDDIVSAWSPGREPRVLIELEGVLWRGGEWIPGARDWLAGVMGEPLIREIAVFVEKPTSFRRRRAIFRRLVAQLPEGINRKCLKIMQLPAANMIVGSRCSRFDGHTYPALREVVESGPWWAARAIVATREDTIEARVERKEAEAAEEARNRKVMDRDEERRAAQERAREDREAAERRRAAERQAVADRLRVAEMKAEEKKAKKKGKVKIVEAVVGTPEAIEIGHAVSAYRCSCGGLAKPVWRDSGKTGPGRMSCVAVCAKCGAAGPVAQTPLEAVRAWWPEPESEICKCRCGGTPTLVSEPYRGGYKWWYKCDCGVESVSASSQADARSYWEGMSGKSA